MSSNTESLIKAIDSNIVHRICSGQVIVSLALAVKELVENSLDAGATNLEIRLKDYGKDVVEVVDDGFGVEEHNFAALTLKHHTSKLEQFSGLTDLSTFGFRGEALSSLCAVSNVCIVTRHKDAPTGTRLEFDHNGELTAQTLCARAVGTTVTLRNLFVRLPVRHKDFLQNLKREFGKMVNLLNAYSLISSNIRFLCTNQLQQGKKTVLSTLGLPSVKENIACVFGAKQLSSLKELVPATKLAPEILEEFKLSDSVPQKDLNFQFEGFISTCQHGKGRSSTDRQFFFVNSRPCEMPKVSKLINSSYHFYNRHQSPFVLLNVSTKKDAIDINVTPDKRTILIHNERLLLAILKNSLQLLFDAIVPAISSIAQNSESLLKHFTKQTEDIPHSGNVKRLLDSPENSEEKKSKVLDENSVREIDLWKTPARNALRTSSQMESFTSLKAGGSSGGKSPDHRPKPLSPAVTCKTPLEKLLSFQRKSFPSSSAPFYSPPAKGKAKTVPITQFLLSKCPTPPSLESHGPHNVQNDDCVVVDYTGHDLDQVHTTTMSEADLPSRSGYIQNYDCDIADDIGSDVDQEQTTTSPEVHMIKLLRPEEQMECSPSGSEKNDTSLLEDTVLQTECQMVDDCANGTEKRTVLAEFSMEALRRRRKERKLKSEEEPVYRRFHAKILQGNSQTAEQELQRELRKEMFQEMEILGQFNLGFVVTKLGSDLFIVDQHATDEKYNYEMLQRNTVMQAQRLVVPQRLELTAVNEAIVQDNLDVFARSGFQLQVDEEAAVGRKTLLLSVPTSRNWVFGKDDVEEMIFMLSDSPGAMCRPSKVQQMFASRACRQSVMVGQALTTADMKKLLVHMGEIEQPWNCPHGRPTIRHLFNLDLLKLAEK